MKSKSLEKKKDAPSQSLEVASLFESFGRNIIARCKRMCVKERGTRFLKKIVRTNGIASIRLGTGRILTRKIRVGRANVKTRKKKKHEYEKNEGLLRCVIVSCRNNSRYLRHGRFSRR